MLKQWGIQIDKRKFLDKEPANSIGYTRLRIELYHGSEGVVVGTAEAAGSLVRGSTTVVVVPSEKPVPAPIAVTPASVMVTPSATVKTAPAVVPSTTIITMHGDGTVTTVTRRASAYELGSAILTPVDPSHRVGPSPHANPYVYRYR